ncbi:hypothetical protein EB795_10260 [Pseudomonas mandelii]|nr:hypothetical protein [Pseudomonas mandelii]
MIGGCSASSHRQNFETTTALLLQCIEVFDLAQLHEISALKVDENYFEMEISHLHRGTGVFKDASGLMIGPTE